MSPSPRQPVVQQTWPHRLCWVGWRVLRYFWGVVAVGLALNALISLAFLNRGTSLQGLYLWPLLDWIQHRPFLAGFLLLLLLGLTGLTWHCSRQGEAHLSAVKTVPSREPDLTSHVVLIDASLDLDDSPYEQTIEGGKKKIRYKGPQAEKRAKDDNH